ncbi:MAG: ABC transporter permease [Xanthobacteraceae bacterium]
MTIAGAARVPRGPSRFPELRLALREMRGGLHGFYVFIACIALGVMAIASVGSFSRGLSEGLARQGRVILGGDVSFILIQREATAAERDFAASFGSLSVTATMRAMARTASGDASLVELKAIDAAYPLYGAVETDPPGEISTLLARRGDVFGAVADPVLISRLNLQPGAHLTIGSATFEITASLKTEPDKLAGGISFGPRLMISQEALRATQLVQPGSLVRWLYRVRLAQSNNTDAAIENLTAAAREKCPSAGWEIRNRKNVSPQLERSIQQFTQYLTLVGLAALLVGGVGIANSAKYFLDRKRDVIATMKSLGASGSRVFGVYLIQVLLLSLIGVVIGLIAGAALPFILETVVGSLIPLPFVAQLYPDQLLIALAYGVLIAAAFALWPLGRAHDVPASTLFRGEIAPDRRLPRTRYIVASAVAAALLAGFAIFAAYDRKIAVIFIGASVAVFVLLRLVASVVMLAARHAPRARSTIVRLAISNIHRPGALTPTVVISLGLGIALLVTVLEIDGNLRRQFTAALPAKAPSFYFVDIPSSEATRFDAFVHAKAPAATLDRVPMLRGRIVSARRVEADKLDPRPDAAWVLQSDRGITFTGEVPEGSRVVDGKWWGSDYDGPPLVSFEKKIADGLGLKVGDEIVVNALGRDVTARIANLRELDWQSLGINFVLVYSPGAFRGAPVMHIATLTYPSGGTAAEEADMLKGISQEFTSITSVRVKDALEAFGALVANLALGVRGASAITLIAAALVLGGALAAGHRHRVYDSVILKTLGATRRKLVAAYALEYALLGLTTGLFGVATGSLAAWRVVTDIMNLSYAWLPGPAVAAAFSALVVTVVFGLAGTFTALGRKPAAVLRNL